MQISNVQASQQIQAAQRRIEGSKPEEVNESVSARAAEAQKNAVVQSTGVGINVDQRI